MKDFCELIPGAVWLSNLEPIVEIQNSLQKIQYFRSDDFGRVLVINGEVQHVEYWSPFYHETITHLPCSFIERPRNALIIGGGSLFAAEELLKYNSITAIDLVDHDMNVIETTMSVYPERQFIVEDKRLNIVEKKYEEYLPYCDREYDLIVNDCFDLFSVSESTGIDYYNIFENLLSPVGICSDLIYRNIYDDYVINGAIKRIPGHLTKAASMVTVPEYPGAFHILTMWGKNKELSQCHDKICNLDQFTMSSNGEFKIYNPNFINFYLYLPPYLKKFIK
ncbi:hypothetical protein [Pseudodesulfovibrio karagichevae]|uniref:Polyamine aminopropyltransferase n=1 Tax=Pseudodesulfovibrio karagichevae TaxID=3239305 RepID=A0ABV4K5R5_9BACT